MINNQVVWKAFSSDKMCCGYAELMMMMMMMMCSCIVAVFFCDSVYDRTRILLSTSEAWCLGYACLYDSS